MIISVEYFKNLSSNKLVISIDDETILSLFAMFVDHVINVVKRMHSLFIFNQNYLLITNVVKFEIITDFLGSAILRSIICNNNAKIRIVLTQNWIQIVFVAVFKTVEICGDDYAKRQLSFVLTKIVFCFVKLLFNFKIYFFLCFVLIFQYHVIIDKF